MTAVGTSPGLGEPRARRMLDRYEILAKIAKGGMGTVYVARLEGVAGFQRLFAIKLMHSHLADDPQFIEMLLDEARLAAKIHHPNAVGIIDIAHAPGVGYYLVMEYVEGFTLAHVLDNDRIPPEDRIRIGVRAVHDAAIGLHHAHELVNHDGTAVGLVHRDVSPQNVLIGLDGVGRIMDFGVARAAARITSSRPGVIKGKPSYMAPEQASGSVEVDRRADVFALGIILWEVLAGGEGLFYSEKGDAAMLLRVMTDEVAPPSTRNSSVSPELDAVCLRALERDVTKRYGSAREFAIALERAAGPIRLIASTHDVADALVLHFKESLEIRRRNIRERLEGSATGSAPFEGSDVFDVPRLRGATPRGSEAWHEHGGTPATGVSVASPSRGGVDPTQRVALPPRRGISGKVAGIAGACAVVGVLGVVLALRLSADEPPAREAAPRVVERTEPIGAPAPPPRESAPETPRAEIQAPQLAELPEVASPAPSPNTPATIDMPGGAAARAQKRRPRSTSMAGEAPALEENPYLNR